MSLEKLESGFAITSVHLEVRAKIPGDYGRSRGIAWYYLGGFGLVHTDALNRRTFGSRPLPAPYRDPGGAEPDGHRGQRTPSPDPQH